MRLIRPPLFENAFEKAFAAFAARVLQSVYCTLDD
jgi:hypothetical protein